MNFDFKALATNATSHVTSAASAASSHLSSATNSLSALSKGSPAAKLDRVSIGGDNINNTASSSSNNNAASATQSLSSIWSSMIGAKTGGEGADIEAGTKEEENADLVSNEEAAWFKGLSRAQRFKGFVGLILLSLVFFALALAFLPMIVFFPAKFALSFTTASLLFLFSFAILRGPVAQFKSMIAADRISLSVMYIASMLATLYSCLIARSYIFVIIFAAIQVASLVWYGISFLPGGGLAMRAFSTLFFKTLKVILSPVVSIATRWMRR